MVKIQQGEIDGMKNKCTNLLNVFKYAKLNFNLKNTINKSAVEQLLSYYWVKVNLILSLIF